MAAEYRKYPPVRDGMSLTSFARRVEDVLRSAGQLDVLLLYAIAAEANGTYLGERELASKIHIPDGPTLLR